MTQNVWHEGIARFQLGTSSVLVIKKYIIENWEDRFCFSTDRFCAYLKIIFSVAEQHYMIPRLPSRKLKSSCLPNYRIIISLITNNFSNFLEAFRIVIYLGRIERDNPKC